MNSNIMKISYNEYDKMSRIFDHPTLTDHFRGKKGRIYKMIEVQSDKKICLMELVNPTTEDRIFDDLLIARNALDMANARINNSDEIAPAKDTLRELSDNITKTMQQIHSKEFE